MDDFFDNLRQYMKQHELLKLKFAQLEKKNEELQRENEELKLQLQRSRIETATAAAVETKFYTQQNQKLLELINLQAEDKLDVLLEKAKQLNGIADCIPLISCSTVKTEEQKEVPLAKSMQVSAISDKPASIGPQQPVLADLHQHSSVQRSNTLDISPDNETPAVVAKLEIPKSPRKYSECSKTPIVNPMSSAPQFQFGVTRPNFKVSSINEPKPPPFVFNTNSAEQPKSASIS